MLISGDTGRTFAVLCHTASCTTLSTFFTSQGYRWHCGVNVVTREGSSAYKPAVTQYIPNAKHVLDRFHVTRMVPNRAHRAEPRRTTCSRQQRRQAYVRSRYRMNSRSPHLADGGEDTLAASLDSAKYTKKDLRNSPKSQKALQNSPTRSSDGTTPTTIQHHESKAAAT